MAKKGSLRMRVRMCRGFLSEEGETKAEKNREKVRMDFP